MLSQAKAGKFFNTAFNNGFLETSTGLMELPEDGPDEFQCFLRWLYGIWMEPDKFSICWAELEFSQQIRLYAFAHKYTIDDLQNAIVCDLHDFGHTHRWQHMDMRREDLEFLVANVPDTSPMHRLLADWLVKDEMDPNWGDEMGTNRGARQIDEDVLERLPDSFVRFVLNHLLNSKISGLKNVPLKAKREYMSKRQRVALSKS